MRIYRDLILLIAIFGLIWLFFTYVPIIPDKDYFGVPVDKEVELGDWIFEYQIENDPAFQLMDSAGADKLALLTQRLELNLEEPLFNYKYYIIDDDQVNAFTIPGGRIFIYRGLIELSERPEEVAAVIAHEIGHAEKRHVLNKLVKEVGLAVLLSGDDVIVGEVVKNLGSTKFDRIQEEKADHFAFELLEKSGIHPKYFASMMLKFRSQEAIDSETFEMLSTHPGTKGRIEKALEYELSDDFVDQGFDMDWEAFKSELKSSSEQE